ncbi:hypothetical protein Trydic_g9433 [Trypoxylus dichotomus]
MITNPLKLHKHFEKRGRLRKTTSHMDRRITRLAKENPLETSVSVVEEMDVDISARTIRRRLVVNNLQSRKKSSTIKQKSITARLMLVRTCTEWKVEMEWRNIVWNDETKINLLVSDGRVYVYRPLGGGPSMVWGCFSWHGVGPIHWIKDAMTNEIYRDILQDVMFPYSEAAKRINKMTIRQLWGKFKAKLGLKADVVKQGSSTTNDGNTSRRFFEGH